MKMAKTVSEYENAIEEFRKATRLAPAWPDPWYNLGIAEQKAERPDDAMKSFRQYLKLAPDAPDAQKVQTLIYELEYKAELQVKALKGMEGTWRGGKVRRVGLSHHGGTSD